MKRIFLGVIFFFITGYVFISWMQSKQARDICNELNVGELMPTIKTLDESIWLTLMGPFEDDETKNMHVVLCSAAAMCDTACNITYKNKQIISTKYINY